MSLIYVEETRIQELNRDRETQNGLILFYFDFIEGFYQISKNRGLMLKLWNLSGK